MIETQPLEVTDFSGGITDYFIDGPPNQYEIGDNLFINPNKKPRTRWGSQLFVMEQIPLGAFRISKLLFLNDALIAFAEKRAYFVDSGSWVQLTGPTSGTVFVDGNANSIIADAEWQGHLFVANDSYSSPQKIFRNDVGVLQVRNAGLPSLPVGTSVGVPAGAGSSYLYAFCFKYQYKVDDVTFIDRGPVTYYPDIIQGGTITSGNGVLISLPTALSTVENWDEASIEIEIYRTLNGETDYFLVDTVTLGTPNYTDETEDATLADSLALYTTGGIASNDTPPKCKFVHVVNDTGYYANLQVGASDESYLIRQSIPGDPDSVPESFFAKAEQIIKGLSSIYDRPIVLCEKYIYRIDNIIDSLGQGSMDLRRIDDRAGCVSQSSIVQTHKGLFWAGEVGFYWSDGFKVLKISDHLNESYKRFTTNEARKVRIVGTYEPANERVIWAVSREDGNNEPDYCYVLDLKWGISPQSSFTTMSGGIYFRPTALAVNDGKIYRGDTRGYVLEHADNLFVDPKIAVGVDPNNWEDLTIVHTYKSCALDFGSKFMRKLVPRILVSAANTTNLSLAITSSNDNNRVVGELAPIKYSSNITWGDDLPLWGDTEARWNFQGLIEEWRRFPAKGLRCNYKQIEFTNAHVQIVTSSLLGQASVDSSLKTATLGGTAKWLNQSVDYYISFSNDGYTEEYLITARTDTTITFSDPGSKVPSGSFDWVIRGMPKGEVLELNGYVFHWAYLSKTHTPFSAGSLGSTP